MSGTVGRELAVSLFPIDASPVERLSGLLLRDVTEERDLERRRDTFVSVASHELRTPMTVVMGFAELLMSGETPERKDTCQEQEQVNDCIAQAGPDLGEDPVHEAAR